MVETLLSRGGYRVKVFDIKVTYSDERIEFFTGDLCRKEVCSYIQGRGSGKGRGG